MEGHTKAGAEEDGLGHDISLLKDGSRLLPGEDPETRYPDDIALWISVYGELIAYKHSLLEASTASISGMTHEAARTQSIQVDDRLIREQLAGFERRLEFWKARQLVYR